MFLSKSDALRELTPLRRQWFAKRKGVITLLRETIFQQEAQLVDSDVPTRPSTPTLSCRTWVATMFA